MIAALGTGCLLTVILAYVAAGVVGSVKAIRAVMRRQADPDSIRAVLVASAALAGCYLALVVGLDLLLTATPLVGWFTWGSN